MAEVKIYNRVQKTKTKQKKQWDLNKIQVCPNQRIWLNEVCKFTYSTAELEKTTHTILKKGAFKSGLYSGITVIYLILLSIT